MQEQIPSNFLFDFRRVILIVYNAVCQCFCRNHAEYNASACCVFYLACRISDEKNIIFLYLNCFLVNRNWTALHFKDFSVELFYECIKKCSWIFIGCKSNSCNVVGFRNKPAEKFWKI